MIPISLIIKYNQIFNDTPLSLKDYLCIIGRRNTLQICTHFMERDIQKEQQDVMNFWLKYFNQYNISFSRYIIQKLNEFTSNSQITVIHSTNLYLIIETALSEDIPDSATSSPTEIEQAFFKALLVANDIILSHQDIGLNQTIEYCDKNPQYNRTATLMLSNQLGYGDYEFAIKDEVAISQLYKCILFFQFAEQAYPQHLKIYLEQKKAKTWQEYIKTLAGFIFTSIYKSNQSTIITLPSNIGEFERICFNQLCSNEIYQEKDWDFICLRNHPLYKLGENEYLILSKLFLAEKLFQSIYFDFSAINKSISLQFKITDFKSTIGYDFSERTLLYSALDCLFRDNFIKKLGKDIETLKIEGGCDFYARSGSKIYIFECKDTLMPKEVKTSYDASKILPFLYERFVKSNTKKAVEQLLQNIEYIRSNKIESNRMDGEKMTIYPIIVTHHKVFDTPTINYFVNQWFQTELKSTNIAKKERIKPVVMINIDILFFMKDLCHQKIIDFNDLLDKYITSILRNEKNALKSSYLSFADKMHDEIFSTHRIPKGITDFAKILFIEEHNLEKTDDVRSAEKGVKHSLVPD